MAWLASQTTLEWITGTVVVTQKLVHSDPYTFSIPVSFHHHHLGSLDFAALFVLLVICAACFAVSGVRLFTAILSTLTQIGTLDTNFPSIVENQVWGRAPGPIVAQSNFLSSFCSRCSLVLCWSWPDSPSAIRDGAVNRRGIPAHSCS